jgi:CheY-like chemotaxis protein
MSEPTPQTERGTILVVDDDEVVREFLTCVLEMEGFQVVGLASTEAALNHLRANRADMLLVDCMMPGMDGRDLYDALKAAGDPLADRIVFMSGNIRDVRVGRFLEEAGAPALEKPFRVAQVREVVGRILGLDS